MWSRKLNIFAICSGLNFCYTSVCRFPEQIVNRFGYFKLWDLSKDFVHLLQKQLVVMQTSPTISLSQSSKRIGSQFSLTFWGFPDGSCEIGYPVLKACSCITALMLFIVWTLEFFEERCNMIALTARRGSGCITVSRPALCHRQTQM